VALLVGPRLANDPKARAVLEWLATALGSSAESGMVGSPAIAANGRGAQDLAGDLVAADREADSAAARAEAGDLSAVLLLGREAWPTTGTARKVIATTGPVVLDETVEVVLPIAHPYEQAGSLTNLEGRVQVLQAAGLPPRGVPQDWLVVADLANHLGGTAPRDLAAIRAAMAEANPRYTIPEGRTGRLGRLTLPVA
jgi:NADH dehydrogenase/NADH:ubiquinone oxidoreductase subunit G